MKADRIFPQSGQFPKNPVPSLVLSLFCLLASLHSAAWGGTFEADKKEFDRKFKEQKEEFDRKFAEQRKKFDQEGKENKEQFGKGQSPISSGNPPPPVFDPAGVPAPADCFLSLIISIRNASTADKFLPYLRREEQIRIRDEQARYDPKQAAEQRKRHKESNPALTEEELDHLTGPAFQRSLKFYKSIARDFIGIRSVSIDKGKAHLSLNINSDAVVNGQKFPYGRASVVLIGEDRFWRLETYHPDSVVYKSLEQ